MNPVHVGKVKQMGNKYDEVYNYRLATIEDMDSIMDFIRREWAENHILARNKELFLWQYGRTEYGDEKSINFVLMTDKNNNILGIIGFVAYDENNDSISPAITKVIPRGLLPMAGLEFMKRQMQIVGEREHFSSGTNPNTILPLYKKVFRMTTGVMQQYYIINEDVKNYNIVILGDSYKRKDYIDTKWSLEEVEDFEELIKRVDLYKKHDRMAFKSPEFIKKRYFDHPIYKYKKWIVKNESGEDADILFGREIERDGARILRFVDYRGDLSDLKKLGKPLHSLLKKEGYEYLDLMVSNLDDYHLDEAGFNLLNPDGDTIIPHYFEPFVRENKKNHFQDKTDVVVFKADGDQDRPNK